jgi:hypothetical protein
VYNGNTNKSIVAYSDSNWASDKDSRKSITGNFVACADGPVSWISQKQKTVTLSSTEAEYMALSDCCRQLVWVNQLFDECGFTPATLILYGDNKGSIFWSKNPITEKRSKHIDIRYHYICNVVEKGHIILDFVKGTENPADILMKNLGQILFEKFSHSLRIHFLSLWR